MEKVLTIVIPTYNMEKFLRRCLDSLIIEEDVLNRLEVLVINDGSKDASLAIAREYQEKYPNIFRVIDKENGNYGSCVNRGIEEATGKYVKVLDADDTFETKNFSAFLIFLSNIDVDCVISDMMQVDGFGMSKAICRFNIPKERIFKLEDLGDAVYNLWMHCVCYKTENLRAICYHQTEGISYTDQEWICLPMSICKRLIYFPRIIYRYLIGRDGQTIDTSVWERNFWMEIKGVKVMMEYRNKSYGSLVPNQNFIDLRIETRMRAVYVAYLLKFASSSNEDLIRDIDSCLLSYNEKMYNDIAYFFPTKLIPIPIVKLWRKRQLGLVSLYRKLYNAQNIIREMINKSKLKLIKLS